MSKEHVLVTGGAGYIGQVLCGVLLEEGYSVTCIDNLMYGQTGQLHLASNPYFKFVEGDVRNSILIKELVSSSDIILPLAALVGAPVCAKVPSITAGINYSSIHLLNAVRSNNQLIVYPNTNSGYGIGGEDICTEDTPLKPISVYGKTKVESEMFLLAQPNTITIRLATVFGISPRMRLDLLVNDFTYRAFTDGYLVLYEPNFKRNYVHIRDVADCFVHCLENRDKMVGRAFNVGNDEANCSKEELALKIKEHLPQTQIYYGEGEDHDKRNYIVSSQRLRETGFECKRGLGEGIEELIKGFRMLGRGQYRNA